MSVLTTAFTMTSQSVSLYPNILLLVFNKMPNFSILRLLFFQSLILSCCFRISFYSCLYTLTYPFSFQVSLNRRFHNALYDISTFFFRCLEIYFLSFSFLIAMIILAISLRGNIQFIDQAANVIVK